MTNKPLSERPARASYQDYYDAPWNAGALRPILIALIAASSIAGAVALLRAVSVWRLSYVLPLALLVALEGVYSTNQLGRPRWRDRRGMLFRLGELIFLLVVLRLADWLFSSGWPGIDEARLWLIHPGSFFDAQFFFVGLLLMLVWGLAIGVTGDFLDLAIQPDEVAAHESAVLSESRSQMRAFRPLGRSEIMGRFATRWAWGGVLLVACAALSRVEVDTQGPVRFGLASLGLPFDIVLALLCYFVAGLALLSQSRLAVLRGRWYNQDIDVRPGVLRRWPILALLALLAVAGIAAMLPVGSTGRFSAGIEAIMAFLMRVFYLVMGLLMLLLTALFYPFRNLFNTEGESPPVEPPPMDVPTQAEAASRLPDWLGGVVVWLVIGFIIIYFVFNYLNAQGVFRGRWAAFWTQFRYWWRARRARLGAAATAALKEAKKRLRPAARVGDATGLRQVRAGRLPPRDRVRYFYLRMVARADEQGVTRPPTATPLEFARTLDQEWPEAEEDVGALTEAFLAARYEARVIERAEAVTAQDLWRRVMRALRQHAPHEGDDTSG